MKLLSKIVLISVALMLFPLARYLDYRSNQLVSRSGSLAKPLNRAEKEKIYKEISLAIDFMGDTASQRFFQFTSSGYFKYRLNNQSDIYITHLSRLDTIYLDESKNYIHVLPNYLEVYDFRTNKLTNASFGDYQLLG